MNEIRHHAFKAICPALRKLYGEERWRSRPTRPIKTSHLGHTIVTPKGLELGSMPTMRYTRGLILVLNGSPVGSHIPPEVLEWTSHALLEGLLTQGGEQATIPSLWRTEQEENLLTFLTEPNNLLVAKDLPRNLEQDFRSLMSGYAANHALYWGPFRA